LGDGDLRAMAGIRSILRKFATKSELYRAMAAEHPVPDASVSHSGLMSAEDKRKLNRIEANATGDMTPDEIAEALISQNEAGALNIDVTHLGGKTADQFATRDHKHDDRYLPRDQFQEILTGIFDQINGASARAHENSAALGRALDQLAETLADGLKPEALDVLLSRLEQTRINAARIGGKTLEDLDRRYAPAQGSYLSAVDPILKGGIRTAAVNGGLVKTGQFSPDIAKGNLWRYSNGGDHIFAAPKTKDDFEAKVAILHHPQFAGNIVFKGFNWNAEIVGEHYRGGAHMIYITKIGPFYDLEIRHLVQTNG
jgi:hypothetical protein